MSIPITEYRNARSISADNSRIDVEINHPLYGWSPYTLDTSDTDMTIDNSELLSLIGSDFIAYTPPTQDELDAVAASRVRAERNEKLSSEVDVVSGNPLRWGDLTEAKQAEWAQYRIDLLNVPQQSGFPNTITWPTKPE